MSLRPLTLLLALTAVAAAAPAWAQAPLSVVDSGKFTWGTAATFPPFEYMEDGKPVGFDVDMMAAIADKMHLQSAPMPMEFKGIIPAILGNRLDASASGMYINPERKQVIDMISYMRVGNQMLVVKGNPLHLAQKMDLCGHRVTAPVATVYETMAKQLVSDCAAANKPELTLLTLGSTAVCALALKEGRADALIASTPTVAALMKGSSDAFEKAGDVFDNTTELGIGVSKDKPALEAAITGALKAMVADGTYGTLMKKYDLPESGSVF
jgi:polar amino acid transport system substrate-binding protein